jgi:hypothetical protein
MDVGAEGAFTLGGGRAFKSQRPISTPARRLQYGEEIKILDLFCLSLLEVSHSKRIFKNDNFREKFLGMEYLS